MIINYYERRLMMAINHNKRKTCKYLLMRKIYILLFLLFMAGTTYAAKIGSLPDLSHPTRITIDGDLLYISDQNSVLVYSMKDFTLVQKIGGNGKGPGEFTKTPVAIILQDDILLFSVFKFSRFKKDGTLMMEKRLPPYSMLINIYPLGNHFVMHSSKFEKDTGSTLEINIVDQDLKKIKTLQSDILKRETSAGGKIIRFMSPFVSFQCNANNIFIADNSSGIFIKVFDFNGESVREFKNEPPAIKIPESVKERMIEDYLRKYSPEQKELMAKQVTFKFPDNFPAMKEHFKVVGDNLYFKTYRAEENREEYIILDTKGNLLKKIFLPETQDPYTFYGNKFYYLKDNEEKEEWEVHCIDLQ